MPQRKRKDRLFNCLFAILSLEEWLNLSKKTQTVGGTSGYSVPYGECFCVLNSPESLWCRALWLLDSNHRHDVGHEGGWMPGEQERVDVVVATRAELSNLPGQVEYELPESGSWGEDLQVYLAGAMDMEKSGELEVSSESIVVPVTIDPNYVDQEEEEERHQYRGFSR